MVRRERLRACAAEGAMSAPARVAILAALPRELRGLVSRTRPEVILRQQGVHLYRLGSAVAVAAGMGGTRVSLAFEAALAAGSISTVVSAGLAGSCTAALQAGAVAEAHTVVDARTGERFSASGVSAGVVLATTGLIASVGEKARLAAAYGAAMVDMEAATVARLAQAHGLAFRAIKGMSDAHDFELASLSRFEGRHGQFRTTAFALHTAVRPHHWRPAAKLGRHSDRALGALQMRLRELIEELS